MAIIIPIGVDTSGLRKLNTAGAKLRALGKVAAVAAGAAALGGLVKTIQIGTEEFMEQQKVVAQTNAVLKSTGGVANVTAKEMGRLSEQLMRKSGVDDEVIQSGQNLLLTFTKIRNETGKNNDIFDQATKATLDLSVAMGKDMSSSAILVGKALNDPVKGATALSRAGVQLTKGQKDQIKAFVESGRVMEAQKIILRELNTQFGGSAEAAGKTLPGQLNILKQTFSNLAGELVSRFMPGIATAATRLTNFISQFAKQPTLRAKVDFVIGTFDKLMWSGIQSISNWWSKPKVAFEDNPANRLRVTIQPAGQDQVASWFRDFKNKMIAQAGVAGQGIGVALANAIFGGVSQGTRKRRGDIIADIGYLYSGAWVFEAGANLATNLWTGFTSRMRELGKGFPDLFRSILDLYNPFDAGKRIGGLLKDGFNREVRRGGSTGLSNVMTKAVKDAVQAARQGLAGAGAALGGTLATVLGATFTRPGGMAPAAITAEERAIEDKRLELEEARLKEAAASVEATEEDKLALREFYLNKEKILRDRALSEEIDTRQRGINDLIEKFNQGLIGAEKFATDLRALIGEDLGTELGTGFAAAFKRELDTVIGTARDIFAAVGLGEKLTGGTVTTVRDVQKEESYRLALKKWNADRAARLKKATDARKADNSASGKTITADEKKEIDAIMKAWDGNNPKPRRTDYGLTALALGGILKKQVFTAGEAGPEAVMPLTGRGGEMLRDALGLGGGAATQVINLTVNAGLGTNPDELSRVIVDSIKRYERRNGQVFSGPLVAATSTAAGVTSKVSGDFNFIRAARRG